MLLCKTVLLIPSKLPPLLQIYNKFIPEHELSSCQNLQ